MSVRVSRVNRKETPPALPQQAEKKSEKKILKTHANSISKKS